MQWYLTKYAELTNGGFQLLSYTPMTFEQAQYHSKVKLPNHEFYKVEHKVGSLLPPKAQPLWVARTKYSHKPMTATFQAEAEIKAQEILQTLDTDFDIEAVLTDMQKLKPILTKPQYSILLDKLLSTPQATKILYERGIN